MSDIHSINYLEALERPTLETAVLGVCYPFTPYFKFNQLPLYIAKLNVSLSAKIVFAEIATSSFLPEQRFRYFKSLRSIAKITKLSLSSVTRAIKELKESNLLWKSDSLAQESNNGRSYYELAWTGDTGTLERSHKLKNLEAGRLRRSIFNHCLYFPLYLSNVGGECIIEGLVHGYLRKISPRTAMTDLYVLGYIVSQARPFFYQSYRQAAKILGIDRKALSASFKRLQDAYLINQADDGEWYLNANPIFAADLPAAKDDVLKLIDKIKGVQYELIS